MRIAGIPARRGALVLALHAAMLARAMFAVHPTMVRGVGREREPPALTTCVPLRPAGSQARTARLRVARYVRGRTMRVCA